MTVLPDDGLSLAAEFPDATREQWQRHVEGVLRRAGAADVQGPAAEDALSTDLQDGIATRPLYTAQDSPGAPGYPGVPPHARTGVLGGVRRGKLAGTAGASDLAARSPSAAQRAKLCHRDSRGLRALAVDALPYHEAGASTAKELGCSLAPASPICVC